MEKRNPKAVTIILLFFSCLFAIVLSETILRIFFPSPKGFIEYIPDGHLMYRLAPKKTYHQESGKILCFINNLGFRRDEDIQYFKPSDTFRLVVLGGSAVFAGTVLYSSSWSFLLEEKLKNKFKNIKIEVINAGVAGYSSFESKINYLYRIRRMSPDAVIVYHTWNDMKFFRPIEAGAVINNPPYSNNPPISLSFRALLFYLRKLHLYTRIRSLYWTILDASPKQIENEYQFPGGIISISDGGPAHQWEYHNFNDLALILKSDGVFPIFVTQASLLSENNVDNPKIRDRISIEHQRLTHRQILKQWHAISGIIKDVSHKHQIFSIDAHSFLPHNLEHFKDHVHLTEFGNQKIADIIFEALKSNEQFTNLVAKYRSAEL
jgi:lysophospholipase L1-like esterase